MSGIEDRYYFLIAVVLYGLSTLYGVFLWRRGFQRDDRINYAILLIGFAFHLTAMAKRGFSFQRCPVTNLYEATVFSMWALVSAYLVIGFFRRFRFLGAFVAPCLLVMGVFGLMPSLDKHGPEPQFAHGVPSLHAALVLLAYGAFGLAAAASGMFLMQQHDLKFNKLRAVLSVLPSIHRLGDVVIRLLVAGFAFLTLGLLAGAAYLKRDQGVFFKSDPKLIWSVVVWTLCLGLLWLRWKVDRGGRRVAWGAVALFVFVMLTFWGSNLLSPIHHPPAHP